MIVYKASVLLELEAHRMTAQRIIFLSSLISPVEEYVFPLQLVFNLPPAIRSKCFMLAKLLVTTLLPVSGCLCGDIYRRCLGVL